MYRVTETVLALDAKKTDAIDVVMATPGLAAVGTGTMPNSWPFWCNGVAGFRPVYPERNVFVDIHTLYHAFLNERRLITLMGMPYILQ